MISGSGQLGSRPLRAYQPNRDSDTPSLGDFMQRSDGFHPMRTSGAALGAIPVNYDAAPKEAEAKKLADETIVLDNDDIGQKSKGKLAGRWPWRQLFKRAGLVMLALILAGAAYFGYKFFITERHLFKGGGRAPALARNIDINQLKGEGDGRVNVLLLGIGGPGHDGPDLTDTVLLASIDPINNSAVLLSIPRDLCVKKPCGPNEKLNAVYALAKQNSKARDLNGQIQDSLNTLDRTLVHILGIPIHYHAVVDFAAFQQSVDAVGGVDVNVPETLYDPTIAWENHYNSVIASKGQQHMDGHKALLYAKSRETSSDFARGERQRRILVALKQKIFTVGTFANPVHISSLLDSLGGNIYTDFSLGDINRLYQIIGQIPVANIISLDMVTPPHDLLITGSYDGSTSIVQPKAGLLDYTDIQSYVRNTLRDGFIAKENSAVAVYNATSSPGLATASARTLKSYGYRVTTVDNAPNVTNPSKTIVVDLSKGAGKYTRHYLEERFGVTARTSVPSEFGISPPAGTGFVIILGTDATASR